MKLLPHDFTSRMKLLLGEDGFSDYMDSFQEPAVRAFRVNTDKISLDAFEKLNVFSTEKIPYVENGYYLEYDKIGSHPYHHAGMIYVQDPGAMATAECLDINPDWWILDMCAAPGGKSSQLQNKLGEKGILVSNEIVPSRCKILTGNIERLGFRNTATTCLDPARLAKIFPETFDLVMVDAPCSGEGMFRKDDTAIQEWNMDNVLHCAQRQKGILEHAVTVLRPGGYIIYATCTFSLEENEMVLDHFLQLHPDFELIPVKECVRVHTDDGVSFDGCHCQSLSYARRFYPHKSRGEGQFMAVLHNKCATLSRPKLNSNLGVKPNPIVSAFLDDVLAEYDPNCLFAYDDKFVYTPPELLLPKGTAFSCGVTIGELRKSYVQPHHQFFMAMGKLFKRQIDLDPDSEELARYLHGEEISVDCDNGWAVITTSGCTVGGVKVVSGRAKNHYPKGLRKV